MQRHQLAWVQIVALEQDTQQHVRLHQQDMPLQSNYCCSSCYFPRSCDNAKSPCGRSWARTRSCHHSWSTCRGCRPQTQLRMCPPVSCWAPRPAPSAVPVHRGACPLHTVRTSISLYWNLLYYRPRQASNVAAIFCVLALVCVRIESACLCVITGHSTAASMRSQSVAPKSHLRETLTGEASDLGVAEAALLEVQHVVCADGIQLLRLQPAFCLQDPRSAVPSWQHTILMFHLKLEQRVVLMLKSACGHRTSKASSEATAHLVQLPQLLNEPGVHLCVLPHIFLRQPVLKRLQTRDAENSEHFASHLPPNAFDALFRAPEL